MIRRNRVFQQTFGDGALPEECKLVQNSATVAKDDRLGPNDIGVADRSFHHGASVTTSRINVIIDYPSILGDVHDATGGAPFGVRKLASAFIVAQSGSKLPHSKIAPPTLTQLCAERTHREWLYGMRSLRNHVNATGNTSNEPTDDGCAE